MPITRKIPVCRVGEVASGATCSFSYGPGTKGILINKGGKLRAYVNRCTHMGGPVSMCREGTLRCAWHGADFDPETGEAIQGQAPAGTFLKTVELVEENGMILAILELPDDPFA
jgi:nitrite reductase/ring-hydroxylating ferredoxin subunit